MLYLLQRSVLTRLKAGEHSLQLGLPIPDKVSVKQHYLRKGANVSDLATVNDFLRFYIVMNRDKINENGRLTADSVNTFTE